MFELIERLVESERPAAERKHLKVNVEVDRNDPIIGGDPDRLRQVFSNVLSNAIKFTPDGDKIAIRLTRSRSRVEVSIADTGVGIARKFLPYVFDRFRQGDSGRTRSHGGLGIGLWLARHLLTLHGGAIDIDSPGPGKGATFTIRLPIPAVAPVAAAREGQCSLDLRTVSLAGAKILVVDDEADARDLLREVLDAARATVMTVDSAEAGLAALRSFQPAVLVSDVGMAGQDGYGMIHGIRALPDAAIARLPAIALTAYASVDDVTEARAAGFDVHLAKPIDPAFLVSAIARLLDGTVPSG